MPSYAPPLRLTIDGDALISNYLWLKARGGSAACGAAIKADGYGLGAREVVAVLGAAGCRDFFVATWGEADALAMLAAAIAKSGDVATVQAIVARAVDTASPAWQRTAVLQGLDAGLDAVGGGPS